MTTDFVAATERYEAWLRAQVEIQEDELAYKHAQMANGDDPFPFFRGTYYRWVQRWPEVCPALQAAPRVLGVGDLHIENFGTWRDSEGRLVWGVNDFDEADELPFTNDLVRLAASVGFASRTKQFQFDRACRAILAGYVEQFSSGGRPFVLEEEHPELRRLAMQAERDPVHFWNKLTAVLHDPAETIPLEAEAALRQALGDVQAPCEIRFRPRVGMGSLGKPRYVALSKIAGGWKAREAKALVPPATTWLEGDASQNRSRITELLSQAVRCADPCFQIHGAWIVRRLAPRCSRIELIQLTESHDERLLLTAMGAEAANIHVGSPPTREAIRQHLASLPKDWLESAARAMVETLRADWKAWCQEFQSR